MLLTRRQMSKDAELLVLRHENAILRRQINRVRYQPGGRPWLAALSRLIPPVPMGRDVRGDPQRHCSPGAGDLSYVDGTAPAASVPAAVHGSRDSKARDPYGNGEPDLGHRRLQGELIRLGHPIAASTVWQILHAAGIDPAPRRPGPTWKQFLTAQTRGILAVDFVHVDTVLLRRLCALIVIEHAGNEYSGDSPASTTSPPYHPTLLRKTQVTTRIVFPSPTGGVRQLPGHGGPRRG